MRVKILGAHRCESESGKCVSLLVEDSIAIDAGGLASSLSAQSQAQLDTLLISHQHYDHIKDIPMIAMNSFIFNKQMNIMGTKYAIGSIEDHVLNGSIYPQFQNIPEEKPTVIFNEVEPLISVPLFNGYRVLPIPVEHIEGSVGYQVSDSHSGSGFLYTADSGPDLSGCWKSLSVNIVITEVTLPNRYAEFALKTNHLMPEMLGLELVKLKKCVAIYLKFLSSIWITS